MESGMTQPIKNVKNLLKGCKSINFALGKGSEMIPLRRLFRLQ